jgi:hypothetical protein
MCFYIINFIEQNSEHVIFLKMFLLLEIAYSALIIEHSLLFIFHQNYKINKRMLEYLIEKTRCFIYSRNPKNRLIYKKNISLNLFYYFLTDCLTFYDHFYSYIFEVYKIELFSSLFIV